MSGRAIAIVVAAVLVVAGISAFAWAASRPQTYTIRCGTPNYVVGSYTYESTLPPGQAPCPPAVSVLQVSSENGTVVARHTVAE